MTELLKRTLRESWEDQVFGQSARLAFYHFMAIFPTLLIVLIPLAHLSAHGSAMRRNLEGSFGEILPNDTATLVASAIHDLDANARVGGALLVPGALAAVWAAINASLAMIVGLNKAYETQEDRGWWRVTRIATGLGTAVVTLVFVALAATHYASLILGSTQGTIKALVQWTAVVLILVISFSLFYRFGPNLKAHEWKWSIPGAVFAALLWTGFALIMRTYFNEFNSYRQIYGRVAPAAMLLLWLYLTSATVLLGAELNSEIEKAREASGMAPALRKGARDRS